MRILEICIIIATLQYIYFPLQSSRKIVHITPFRISLLDIVLFVLHWLLEGLRWQMIPAYIILFLAALGGLLSSRRNTPTKHAKLSNWLIKPLASIFLVLSILFSAALPVFHLPKPTGPYEIGTTYIHMIDNKRPETFNEDPNDSRELMVRVWYPAELSLFSRRMPYLPDADLTLPPLFAFFDLPTFVLNHLDLVKTHSHLDAPLANAEQRYPVLVFSHGYTNSFEVNQAQMEELASHGYIIFSINHTFEAFGTVFPDGRIAPISKDVFFALSNAPYEYFDDHLATWVADTAFVVDQIEKLNTQSGHFHNRLDMSRLGVFGMSYGSPTAEEFCLYDDRCKAVVNMDGSHYGFSNYVTTPLKVPYMTFHNQNWRGPSDDVFSFVENYAYKIDVDKSEHLFFTDGILWTPLLVWVDQSPIPFSATDLEFVSETIRPNEMIEIVNAYLLAFFNKHLKQQESSLLDQPVSPFEQVDFYSRTP